jgi:energy-coupling factor transporter ATP-binding protein EcfA2
MPARLNAGPQLVELAGPAGVGKSTLAQVLQDRCTARSATIWGQPVLPLIGNGLQLLPTLLGFWRQSHSLLWDESRHLVRLQTLLKALKDAPPPSAPITLFDEGPVFALAWLRGFGHESMRSDAADDWWRTTLQEWSQTIAAVVVLDASDDLLARRIRTRSNWHEVKGLSDREIATWMARFRVALNWVLAGLAATGRVVIVRITIDREHPDRIAEHVLAALQSASNDN